MHIKTQTTITENQNKCNFRDIMCVLFVEKEYFYCVEFENILFNAFDTYMLTVKPQFYYTTYLSKQIASLFNQTSNGILSINYLISSTGSYMLTASKNTSRYPCHTPNCFLRILNRKFLKNKIDAVKFHQFRYLTKNQYLM